MMTITSPSTAIRSLSFTEDRAKRYQAYGWFVQIVGGDGNDMAAFEKALKRAQKQKDRPCFIQLAHPYRLRQSA